MVEAHRWTELSDGDEFAGSGSSTGSAAAG
jgi:hypothetical protein